MFRQIYDCIAIEHDFSLVLLAAVICLFASYTAMSLLMRARDTFDGVRRWWTFQTAFAAGAGIWSTHFVAMLAYDPGMIVAYDLVLTVLSVLVAVTVTGIGFAVAVSRQGMATNLTAGGIIGFGVASMHYIGTMAVRVPGQVSYDGAFLLLAVFLGVILSILALWILGTTHKFRLMFSTLAFTFAICALHFTAMTAVKITYDPMVPMPVLTISGTVLVFGVALASIVLLGIILSGALVDRHAAANLAEEATRLRALANAALDGVVLLDGQGRILDANESFLALTGRRLDVLRGISFQRCFRGVDIDFDWPTIQAQRRLIGDVIAIHASGSEKKVDIYLCWAEARLGGGPVAIVRDQGLYALDFEQLAAAS